MNSKYIGVACSLFLLLFAGCDEGTIYPDDTIDSGRTASVTVTFNGINAWPKENYLSLAAFGEDAQIPLLTKRISKPTLEGKERTIKLNNLSPETKSIEIAIVSNGKKLIYSYHSHPVEKNEDHLDLDFGVLDLASFDRIQSQVFKTSCLSCHGESSSGLSGKLDLRKEAAYKALVNVEAPLSKDGKNYVTPGNPNNSFLLDILEDNPIHKDMFNSYGKQEVVGLIETWIKRGAADN